MTRAELKPGVVVGHVNGTFYRVVSVDKHNIPWAQWRQGTRGRFGKEVVQLSAELVKGFRVCRPPSPADRKERRRAGRNFKPTPPA